MIGGSDIPLSYADKTGEDFSIAMHRARLTITDVSEVFEITRRTVYAWTDARELPYKAKYVTYLLDRAMERNLLPLANKFPSKNERIKVIRNHLFS